MVGYKTFSSISLTFLIPQHPVSERPPINKLFYDRRTPRMVGYKNTLLGLCNFTNYSAPSFRKVTKYNIGRGKCSKYEPDGRSQYV